MAERGEKLIGVRIDSGDLPAQAHAVREILNESGLQQVKVLGSGGLDEYDLDDYSSPKFLSTATESAPRWAPRPTRPGPTCRTSWSNIRPAGAETQPGKVSWPGKKQVFRQLDERQGLRKDTLGLREEKLADSEPLLENVMADGCAIKSPPLATSRQRFLDEFQRLDGSIKAVRNPAVYPVDYSDALRALQRQVGETIKQQL